MIHPPLWPALIRLVDGIANGNGSQPGNLDRSDYCVITDSEAYVW